MTARSALTVVGQVVGAYLSGGSPYGAAIGGMIGGYTGGQIDGPESVPVQPIQSQSPEEATADDHLERSRIP